MTFEEIETLGWEVSHKSSLLVRFYSIRNPWDGDVFYMKSAYGLAGEGTPARMCIKKENTNSFDGEYGLEWQAGTLLFDGTIESKEDLWNIMRYVKILDYHDSKFTQGNP